MIGLNTILVSTIRLPRMPATWRTGLRPPCTYESHSQTLTGLLDGPARHFDVTLVVSNRGVGSEQVVAPTRFAGRSGTTIEAMQLRWPAGAYSLSHVAIPFEPSDRWYGCSIIICNIEILRNSRTTNYLVLVFAAAFILACAEEKGPAERTGEKLDDAVEEVEDDARDLGDQIEEEIEGHDD